MWNGENTYLAWKGKRVDVKCYRYTGEAKFMYFALRPNRALSVKELRDAKVYVGVMIPNGNVWEYDLQDVTIEGEFI